MSQNQRYFSVIKQMVNVRDARGKKTNSENAYIEPFLTNLLSSYNMTSYFIIIFKCLAIVSVCKL